MSQKQLIRKKDEPTELPDLKITLTSEVRASRRVSSTLMTIPVGRTDDMSMSRRKRSPAWAWAGKRRTRMRPYRNLRMKMLRHWLGASVAEAGRKGVSARQDFPGLQGANSQCSAQSASSAMT